MPVKHQKKARARAHGDAEAGLPWYKRTTIIVALIGALAALAGTFVQVALPKLYVGPAESGALRGRVSGPGGRSLGGAKVVLEGKGLPPLIYTDSEGVFNFSLPADMKEIKIRVEASGYETYERRVDVSAKRELEDIRLEAKPERKVSLSGAVVDDNERPLQGAKVTLDDLPGIAPVETASDGQFNFDDLPLKLGDRVRLRVVLEGYKPYLEDVVLGNYPPKINLTKGRRT